jgi:hypothetical protein
MGWAVLIPAQSLGLSGLGLLSVALDGFATKRLAARMQRAIPAGKRWHGVHPCGGKADDMTDSFERMSGEQE